MKIWRKNRTKYAKEFFLDGKMILAFLVGEQFGIQNIETLKGEIKIISKSTYTKVDSEHINKTDLKKEIVKSGNVTFECVEYSDGRKEFMPI